MRPGLRACAMAVALASVATMAFAGSGAASYPGANGRIVFAHDPSPADDYDIFTMNPDGSDRLQLTSDPGNELRPKYSADGERIVFTRRPSGSPENQIWVMNHDGSDQMQLTDGFGVDEPTFSPDGSKIAFERDPQGIAQIWVMDADGSNPTQLTFPGPDNDRSHEPSYSSDGRIVFSRRSGATNLREIWVMNADGSGQTKLTTAAAGTSDLGPSFSPDGLRIIYDHFTGPPPNEDIFVMNADGSGQTQVTSGPGQDYWPVFSPTGTQVLFERETQNFTQSNLLLADPNGLNLVTPLADNPAGVYDSTPDWQPLNPPACSLAGETKQRSLKQVAVTVSCDENGIAVAEGSGQAPKVPKAAFASKKKTFTIPPVTAQLQPGASTTITLTIPKKGRKALKKAAKAGKKGKATITATVTDDLAQSTTETFTVTFKAKKKKKK